MNNKSNRQTAKPKHVFLRPDTQIITDREGKPLVVIGHIKDMKLKTGVPSSFKKALGGK